MGGDLQLQKFSTLSSWQHADRPGAGEGTEGSMS